MRTRPKRPLSMSRRACRIGALKLWLWPTISLTPALCGRRDHGLAVREGDRHRLLDQHMLAVRGRQGDVLRVELMRRRHIDRVDAGVGAQLLDRLIGAAAEIRREPRRAPPARGSAARRERDARVGHEGRQHEREGAPETGDAQAQVRAIVGRAVRSGAASAQRSMTISSERARDTQTMMNSSFSCSARTRSR